MPGSRKQPENFLEFLKIPCSNRLKVPDPTFTFIYIRMVGLWLRWKPCAGNTSADDDLCTNLVPRGRDPFGQRRGSGLFRRMTKGSPVDEVACAQPKLQPQQ